MDERDFAREAVELAKAAVSDARGGLRVYEHEYAVLIKERASRRAALVKATVRMEAHEARLSELEQITAPIRDALTRRLTALDVAKKELTRLDAIEHAEWLRQHPRPAQAAGMLGSREMEFEQ